MVCSAGSTYFSRRRLDRMEFCSSNASPDLSRALTQCQSIPTPPLRFIAGLVSKKSAKTDVATKALPARRSAFEASNVVIPLLESLCVRAAWLGKGMRTRESADDYAKI